MPVAYSVSSMQTHDVMLQEVRPTGWETALLEQVVSPARAVLTHFTKALPLTLDQLKCVSLSWLFTYKVCSCAYLVLASRRYVFCKSLNSLGCVRIYVVPKEMFL